ncbi:unnamed protein product [Heterosigma akashiwo]
MTEKNIGAALTDVEAPMLDAGRQPEGHQRPHQGRQEEGPGMEVTKGVTPEQQFVKVMGDELVRILGGAVAELARGDRVDALGQPEPTVILLAGLQGAGKTTAAGKLALYCKGEAQGRRPLLCAADVYRPAAIDQLKTLGGRIGVEVFSQGTDADPVEIARAAVAHAKAQGYDTVIVDTAGRQVIDENLMAELKNIKTAVNPDEVLLVLDAMTGQEAATPRARLTRPWPSPGARAHQAGRRLPRAGALQVYGVSGKPIKFIGVGEQLDKLEPFYPDRMASRILGMGDVISLVEKAQEQVSEDEAMAMTMKMMDNTFDFDDFLKQSEMMNKMGSMANVVKMLPGMAGKVSQAKMDQAEGPHGRPGALIKAMNAEERGNPDLLIRDREAWTRLRRISADAGYSFDEAREFILEFQQMKTIMSRMSKQMGMGGAGSEEEMASAMAGRAQPLGAGARRQGQGQRFGGREQEGRGRLREEVRAAAVVAVLAKKTKGSKR